MIKTTLLSGLAAAAMLLAPAHAATVIYEFTTTITSMSYYNFGTMVSTPITSSTFTGTLFQIGDTASGRFAYNTEHPLWYPPSATAAAYNGNSAGTEVSILFDTTGFRFASNPDAWTSIQVNDTPGWDYFNYRLGSSAMDHNDIFQVVAHDYTGNGLTGVALPTELGPTMFTNAFFSYAWVRHSDQEAMTVSGRFSSIKRVAEVPEPASAGLLLAGLALLGLRRRTARR